MRSRIIRLATPTLRHHRALRSSLQLRLCMPITLNNNKNPRFLSSITYNDSRNPSTNHSNDIETSFPKQTSSSFIPSKLDLKSGNYLMLKYNELVQIGNVTHDKHQVKAIQELDRLRRELLSYSDYFQHHPGKMEGAAAHQGEGSNMYNTLSNLFSKIQTPLFSTTQMSKNKIMNNITGVYLHGGVGCGKTFSMDLFYESLLEDPNRITASNSESNENSESKSWSKQKVHFHKFMLQVHQQMHQAKMVQKVEGDPLPTVIQNIIQKGKIICFDEFQVTDVADALILRRLFTGLIEEGAIIVATSNRPPKDLYKNGIQRDLFLPFISLLEQKCNVVSMWESETDYRLVQGQHKAQGVYFVNNDENNSQSKVMSAKSQFLHTFEQLTKNDHITSIKIATPTGRQVSVPQASQLYNISKFSFDDLCRKPLGAADYLAIGEHFHTVFIEDVPKIRLNEINVLRRFITFIDAMYECHVKLIIHAGATPDQLLDVDMDAADVFDEIFAFDRTRSRLEEMGSEEYLKKSWVKQSSMK